MNKSFSLSDLCDSARNNFMQGNYSCSESVVNAFLQHLQPNVSNEIIAMASGFSGGMGGTQCICGTVSGAVMILGLCFGRTEPKDPKISNAMKLTKAFYTGMTERKGSLCCAKLTKNLEPGSPERKAKCAEMVEEACTQAAKIIMENLDIKNTDALH